MASSAKSRRQHNHDPSAPSDPSIPSTPPLFIPYASRSGPAAPHAPRALPAGHSRAVGVAPAPPARWPIWARALALLARPGEIGVGDTVHRLAKIFAGEALVNLIFKRIFPLFGIHADCGCRRRQDSLNIRYCYSSKTGQIGRASPF